ncbi:hypothetical protein TBS_15410 [Thermobispora bispora]|jgi:gas vesicle structural protein|uniref:Gas vesicle protein A n=1 Tax=Thermobispora bispora (strain ATCC 19993 / DSM 43833 / CBS 139.67 / JCM 10125 / KCTC 9307 / NBRC 14880 / R51) TaxID=469371 RepID=D6Y9P1_THEBD|nr:gas vesicle protein GvpJ [Thermobispora bispora]MBO2473124.1 gas vesicle protein [Actinomycetales bacterium]MDI9581303.1 gas vesicle protein GvpJ [Thermobispora sp.]ADG90072.1 gas vesicle protein GVPa [Thermobispora bispora DSM 43833]MBX6169085.1 gas vesicle structural protein GvpA [Thermobispora bispora]QSI46523.1 gas vesicle structural protein GvpA [Thermobispora bispora]
MTVTVPPAGGAPAGGGATGSGLADVIDTILDKGLVIDAYVRVSLVGIEVLTIDARVVVASVDTYLRFASAVNRLDLTETQDGLPELVGGLTEGVAHGKSKGVAKGVIEAAGDKLREFAASEEDRRAVRRRRGE